MRRSFLVFVCVLSALLTGCAINNRRPLTEQELTQTRRVGVVSLLGDTFHGISIGTTVFNNEWFDAKVPDWDIDGYVQDQTLVLLRRDPRFEPVVLDRGGLDAALDWETSWRLLAERGARAGLDRLIVLRPTSSTGPDRQFIKPGFGLYERSMFGLSRRCVYASYIVEVVDVKSAERLAWEWGGSFPCDWGSHPELVFLPSFDRYLPLQVSIMRQQLKEQLDRGLRYAFEELALLPPGAR